MDRISFIKLLAAQKELNWAQRHIDGTNETINWLPVVSYECSAGVVHSSGLCSNGYWCSEYADNKRVVNPDNLYSFFTILEFQLKEFVLILKNSIKLAKLPESVIKTYPFDSVVLSALKSNQHWATLANAWLEQGFPISPQIAIEFPDNKLVRRWQKSRIEKIINA